MSNGRGRGIRRWITIGIPTIAIAIGLVMVGWFGWDYAKQTVLLRYEKLPTYSPPPVPSPSKVVDARPEQTVSGTGSISTVHKSTNHEPIRRPITHPIVLWPTLPEPGTKIGSLSFPSLNMTVPVVQGTAWDQLKLGAGHYMASDLPGQGGKVFLAGHRDTVFWKLRFLKLGNQIVFHTPYGDFVYRATRFQIVSKYDTKPLTPTNYETLTLSTCYPFFFIGHAPDRYIIFTKLVSEPRIATLAAQQRASHS